MTVLAPPVRDHPDPEVSDEVLLHRAREGDGRATELLFQRHYDRSKRVAIRLLGHEHDAQEAVQDAMFKAIRGLGEFDGRSAFSTWLMRIVTNAAKDLGRRRGRRSTTTLEAIEASGEDRPLTIESPSDLRLRRSDLRSQLDQALGRLSETLRTTFVLYAEGEMSYKEIAEVQNIAIGTVMSRIHSARAKLKALVQDLEGL